MSFEFQTFTDMCLDGPSRPDSIRVFNQFNPSCLVKSFRVDMNTSWEGKRYGDISHIEFHEEPSAEALNQTSVMLNPSPYSNPGYVTKDQNFLNYMLGFAVDKDAFIKDLKYTLSGNFDAYFPKVSAAETAQSSSAPSLRPL